MAMEKQYVGRSNDELRACLEDEFGKSEMITYQANQKKSDIRTDITHGSDITYKRSPNRKRPGSVL